MKLVLKDIFKGKKISKLKKIIKKRGYKKVFPVIYFLVLLTGIILTFVYAFIPSFVICSSIFGNQFCTPTGIYIILFVSLPGYIISGNLLAFISDIPWALSFAVVMITSFLFYYLLGLLIDKYRGKAMDAENISKLIIVIFFFILLLFLISLL